MQQENFIHLTRSEANQLIPSLESAYNGLLLQGKYLPKMSSSVITSQYLLQVLYGRYFVPNADKISIGILFRSIKKYELVEELQKIKLQNGQEWGFSSKRLPDKLWITNVLKTLQPNHPFFQKHQLENAEIQKFTNEQLIKIKNLDTSYGKKSQIRRFFQISKEEQQFVQYQKQQKKKEQLEKRILRKNLQLEEIKKEIQTINEQFSND